MIYLFLPASFIVLWVLFLAYTALKANWKTLRFEVKVVGVVVVLAGWLIDVFLNWTAGWALGVGQEWTLSQRCGRLKQEDDWRAGVACYLCRTWLDPFELGGHCK